MVQFLEGLFANPKECVGFQGNIQLALLMLAYGYGLGRASMLISHGTEKLMLLPAYTGLIGSVVLPLLGAVPDGAFILFSGLGPNAQDDLAVGVGALAGSTILLVTVTWGLSIINGRVHLTPEGKGMYNNDPKLKSDGTQWNLASVGVNCHPSVKSSARIMMATSLGYCIIQGPAFAEDCGRGTLCQRKGEQHWWAFAGVFLCILAFLGYLFHQMRLQSHLKHQVFEDDAAEEEERAELVPSRHLPEHLRSQSVAEQEKFLKRRACSEIATGLALIMLLTDPMVDVLQEFSARIRIPPFFVAFILAPLASSSLEIIAACEYAAKKTVKTTTISLASIVGAACMNNTFCLAIFLILVFVKGLAWEFAAETLTIVLVQLAVGLYAQRTLFRLRDAYIIMAMYPLSIMIVVLLEAWGLN